MRICQLIISMLVLIVGWTLSVSSYGEAVADIANTKHNLSISGSGDVKAISEDQVCVFCHTPHGATNSPGAPLWNRVLSTQTYTPYTSASLDAEDIAGTLAQPAGSSKLCLSCHDGTLAIGTVNVLGGQQNVDIAMSGVGAGGVMPDAAGVQSGFTRNLGVDLTNDHPISLDYDSNLASVDGELTDPASSGHIAVGVPGLRPPVPLEATGQGGAAQIQCGTCHDPHLKSTNPGEKIKFLRLNRFQQSDPGVSFNQNSDIVCLACHEKAGWRDSAHAISSVADEQYNSSAANERDFPASLPVWKAACLNCHDTHTVHGARRLLREGTDSLTSPKTGGGSAIEETCYQCHTSIPIISNLANEVPDIETDFNLGIHMPITSSDQLSGGEAHDITDADFSEGQVLLGKTSSTNRHAECTDCHNPHRVMKNRLFNGSEGNSEGTHNHASGHTNIASGVLRGMWGVEPNYGSSAFLSLPISYTVKKGDGGLGAGTDVTNSYVTREYQICLKCHSDYGYDDNGVYPIGTRPDLGVSGGGTPANTNNMVQYTNQAMEFQAPLADRGEPGGNHRSWHPVIRDTGRSAAVRNMSSSTNMFLSPWNGANIGSQEMYCSDCHGSATGNGTVVPTGNNPWGPHGSSNNFLLKGTWNSTTGNNDSGLCFRCHNHTNYATEENEGDRSGFESGFGGEKDTNLHAFHAKRLDRNLRCSWCHTAVPHGWKNKALLVNLNDVGEEAGLPPGTEISITGNGDVYNQGPYYNNAKLKVRTWKTSGNWTDSDCGSASGQRGTGRDWMENVCTNPP